MGRKLRILHVIERLAPGGASTALVEVARRLSAAGQQHQVLSLCPPVAAATEYAQRASLEVIDAASSVSPTYGSRRRFVEAADLVWVHAWTSPGLDAFLRCPHPPARWLLWMHVAGDSPPHILTPSLANFPDVLVASSSYTARLSAFADARSETRIALSGSDLTPFLGLSRQDPACPSFRIGYVGTLDAGKMHPDFIAISAAAALPKGRFDIYGTGPDKDRLKREIEAFGDPRFHLHGWTHDVAGAVAAMDAFGYPLARPSHATAELVLQEAMAAGVPPVVLDHGAAVHLIEHERTGLIARDEVDYARCLERLAFDPTVRRSLGDAARRQALAQFGADHTARAFEPILGWLLERPKRERVGAGSEAPAADRFTTALGSAAGPFLASQSYADDRVSRSADETIAAASPALSSATSGGILHWRRAYPTDPWLRLWSGLVHMGQGRMVPALGEFLHAREAGLASPRLERYIASCTAAASG